MRSSSFIRYAVSLLVPFLLASAATAQETKPPAAAEAPRLEPGSKEAKPLTVYQWTAKAGATDEYDGYRYTWCLPRNYKRTENYDLIVICHGAGADYRWGHANLTPEQFRPGNIVVSVDGTSEADDGSRAFLLNRRDAIEFRDFVLEIGRALPVDRIFLYGHEQGSAFSIFMASQFPGIFHGVVVQASGPLDDTNLQGGIQSIPIAFLHGTADPEVPYYQSLIAREAMRDAGHQMLLVRRLQGHDHRPSSARAGECIEWCSGMSATRAATALAAAEALLEPSMPDEHGHECPAPFGAALQVLRRVTLDVENHVEEADDDQRARAQALIGRIDAEGSRHVEVLRKDIKSADDLILGLGEGEGAWLGHLVALREDFRGVPSVEAFIKELDYDAAAREQWAPAMQLLDVWYANRPDRHRFEVVANAMGDCFLVDAFPSDLQARMAALKDKAGELELSEESLEKFGVIGSWSTAWTNGYARYLELCKQWK